MSLAECTALLVRAVNENSVSLLEFAKRTYSEHQLLASLVQCNEEGETPLVIAMRGKNDCVIDELVKVMKNCDRTIEENQLKLSIAINQLSHQIPIVELIGYLVILVINELNQCDHDSSVQDSYKWMKFIARVFEDSTSSISKDKIITALELIGAISIEYGRVSSILFGLECWKVAMILRYCPEDGQPLLPKIPDESVLSEASSLIYGSAIEVTSFEELDIFKENFENGFQDWCFERIKIQALLVIRRITTQANLEYPHWLYLKGLLDFTDFYFGSDYKLAINLNVLTMEQLNGFDPKLIPRKTFYFFIRTISLMSEIFFKMLRELPPARKELNYQNFLAPTEFITTMSKFFSHPAMISSVDFWNADLLYDYYSFAEIVFRFLIVLDKISPEFSNQEKQKLEEYYSNFIRNFFPRRTFNVLHEAMYRYVNDHYFFFQRTTSSPSSITNLILKLGANPNAADEDGQTPLHILARDCSLLWDDSAVPVFRALVDADTHLDTATDKGKTVMSKLKENLLFIKEGGEIAQPYFESLANTVFPLRCYCARVIRRYGIPFDEDRLPIHLQEFVAMHSDKTSPAFQ